MIWTKALRKLRLGKAAFAVLSPFCRKTENMTMEEAQRILAAVYPEKDSRCVRETPRRWDTPEYDLSILVPTYNNSDYIEASIRSAVEQETEYRVEVIAVNDGSTDDTGKKLEAFAGRDNVTVVTQPNGGVSAARNAAIDQAKGRYLLFLDGDDVLLSGAVQALLKEASENDCAVVEGGYRIIDPAGNTTRVVAHAAGKLDPLRDLSGFPCFKVMRRDLWAEIDFPVGMYFEDSIIAQILWERVALARENVHGLDMPVGGYRINLAGFSQSSKARPCCVDTVWITRMLARDRERLSLACSSYYYEHLLDMAVLSRRRTENMPEEVRRAVFTMYRAFLQGCGNRSTSRSEQIDAARMIREGRFRRFELMCALCR